MQKCIQWVKDPLRSSTHHYPRVPSELYAGRVSGRSLNTVARRSNYLVQRSGLFVGDAGLGDPHQLEHGLRVDEGEEADHVARAVFGVEGF
jgi:hypothetical protein